jgi:hypothetical protein
MTAYKYKKIMGVMILTLMIYSYISFNPAWNHFFFNRLIEFLRFIEFPIAGWVFLDKYLYNGAL